MQTTFISGKGDILGSTSGMQTTVQIWSEFTKFPGGGGRGTLGAGVIPVSSYLQVIWGCGPIEERFLEKKKKKSSMELAVIWGNSDFGCSDVSCFDLGCSDFSHSDFGHFFLIKILTFFTQHSQLGNSFGTPKWNEFDQMELLHIVSTTISTTTKIIAQYPFSNFLVKKWLFNLNFSPT